MSFYFPNIDPAYIYKRRGDSSDPYITLHETAQVVNGTVVLREIPEYATKVITKKADNTTLTEVTTDTLLTNQYRVDYSTGVVYLHTSVEANNLTFDYKGTGYVSFPANRVWIDTDTGSSNKTLQQMFTDIDNVKTNWLTAVTSFVNIATSYPTPKLGDTVQTTDDSRIYRFNGSVWVFTQQYTENAITNFQNRLDSLSKVANKYEWTSSEGQLIYTLPPSSNLNDKWLEVTVGGATLPSSLVRMDSATQFTLLVNSTEIPAGIKVTARWVEPFIPATMGHTGTHEKGGFDEIDLTKLKGYQENVVTPLAESTNRINSADINALYPPVPLVAAKGDGVTDDASALNALIDFVSLNGKKLLLPPSIYGITSPLVFPQDSTKRGVEITGNKSETKYEDLAGADSTVIKALSAMTSLVTNRGANPSVNVANYSVLKNVVLDGNNLAQRGYINGWQDKFMYSKVKNCTIYGVSLGDLTNMTLLKEVTLVKNAKGLESVGANSTVWIMEKCTVRENTSDGATISSAINAVITNTIFESNGGRGVQLLGTTDVTKFINGLKFDNCYWENNGGYAIETDRAGTISPAHIDFVNPAINSNGKAVNIIYGDYVTFKHPIFAGALTTSGYFVNANGNYVTIYSDENRLAAVNMSISGTNSGYITKIMDKMVGSTKGLVISNVVKAAILKPDKVVAGSTMTLTGYQVAGALVVNSSQIADTTLTLPTPDESFQFRGICTLNISNFWKFATIGGTPTIYLNGVACTYVQNASPKIGDCIDFNAFRRNDGTYCWLATPVYGTWTGA